MECCPHAGINQSGIYLRTLLEPPHAGMFAARPRREELAENALEVFADEERITVVIHSGRYQVSIEIYSEDTH
jgi:hypothetical protein